MSETEAIEAPKKKGKKKLILIALALLLVIGGIAGVVFSGILGGSKKADAADADGKTAAPVASSTAAVDNNDVFDDLPDIVVNLDGTGRQQHFLKMKISLELASKADQAIIDKIMPRVTDEFQTYLRELRIDDLHGSAGIYRMRQELLIRVSAASAPVPVKDVLFRELLIQ